MIVEWLQEARNTQNDPIDLPYETEEKFVSRDWLDGKGRAAESVLAKQVLGTKEGFQESSHPTIEEELLPVLDALLLWLSMEDKYARPP
jgi:hypothetical protein